MPISKSIHLFSGDSGVTHSTVKIGWLGELSADVRTVGAGGAWVTVGAGGAWVTVGAGGAWVTGGRFMTPSSANTPITVDPTTTPRARHGTILHSL
jgi:hypothetical protein